MKACDRPAHDWTVVLRRQPARIVAGRPEGGYTNVFEIVCCDCGDQPDLDYREVSPELQRIRGPYPIAAGVAAYGKHVRLHPPAAAGTRAGRQEFQPSPPLGTPLGALRPPLTSPDGGASPAERGN